MKSERLALSCLLAGTMAAVTGSIYAQDAQMDRNLPQTEIPSSEYGSQPSQMPTQPADQGVVTSEVPDDDTGRAAFGEPSGSTTDRTTGQTPEQTTGQMPYDEAGGQAAQGEPTRGTPYSETLGQQSYGTDVRGQAAYGEGANVITERASIYCSTPDADWNFNDPNCPASSHILMQQGRAAYGEPTGMPVERGTSIYCSTPDADWNFNDPSCHNYIPASEGRAAYGEAGRTGMEMMDANVSIYCSTPDADWNFDIQTCPSYLGESGTYRQTQ